MYKSFLYKYFFMKDLTPFGVIIPLNNLSSMENMKLSKELNAFPATNQ